MNLVLVEKKELIQNACSERCIGSSRVDVNCSWFARNRTADSVCSKGDLGYIQIKNDIRLHKTWNQVTWKAAESPSLEAVEICFDGCLS